MPVKNPEAHSEAARAGGITEVWRNPCPRRGDLTLRKSTGITQKVEISRRGMHEGRVSQLLCERNHGQTIKDDSMRRPSRYPPNFSQ